MGQSRVMLLRVTPVLTIPVGFAFYEPDPRLKAWEKEEQRLKKQDVPKKNRYEGWGQLAKQTGEEGASRGLILSLLLDHCLLLPPEQTARLENNLPACTVGSLCEKSRVEALLAFIRRVLHKDNPQARLRQLADQLEQIFPLRDSSKHMNGRDLGRIGPTP
jgi:hypothetical protein